MTVQAPKLVPCIWFDDQAQAAAEFYAATFSDARVLSTSRYPESFDNPAGKPRGSVMTVEFEVFGQRFTALNGGPMFKPNPSLSFFVHLDTAAQVDAVCRALLEGGSALMALDSYPWSERYAWVRDRFGVTWQLMLAEPRSGGARIAPCLMFSGASQGRAAEAIELYVESFEDARVESLEHYAAGEGPEGSLKHGRFVLAGTPMVAMDSHVDHDIAFDAGLSLQVMCRHQAQVDRYWNALSAGGTTLPCGWLQDRFGLSWQVVPTAIEAWATCDDPAARDRAFSAMLQMGKLEVEPLEAALRGEA